jgi:hypothetical protein
MNMYDSFPLSTVDNPHQADILYLCVVLYINRCINRTKGRNGT